MNKQIPIIIPAYEPDEKMIILLEKLKQAKMSEIVVVDDGSQGKEYQNLFRRAKEVYGCKVLQHAVNLGKGRALKTAFNYCLNTYTDMLGVITIDSDGQHKVEDMIACMEKMKENPNDLILGCRDFKTAGVPLRSSFGNICTSKVFKYLIGVEISDTQTGLRGISTSFMKTLMNVKGERFEFETNMLIETKDAGITIREVKIETIYLEDNKSSHFNPIKDSIQIYAAFGKFLFSSLSSSVVDLSLFALFCSILRNQDSGMMSYLVLATILARVCSATYNFLVNYKVVFKSDMKMGKAMIRYFVLAVIQMSLSAILVNTIYPFMGGAEILVKIPVDVFLFLASFVIQRELVYK